MQPSSRSTTDGPSTPGPSARQIAAIYTRLAAVYDVWAWALERRSLSAALSRAGLRDGEAVLEVAVGSGRVFREVLRRNPSGRNVGTDLAAGMLAQTRARAERTGVPFALELADARRLPFEDASFDLVLCNNMLGLLPGADVAPAVRELLRVLRPGGRLALVMMKHPERTIPRWIYRLGAMRLGGWRDVELAPILRANGLPDVQREVVTQLGFPSEILLGRKPRPAPVDGEEV